MTAKAIETRYAGYRFRSRLEARWAVFFESLKIVFDYETEGYLVGRSQKPYLPDFWLPGEKVWVEVKGSEEQLDVKSLASAASAKFGLPATGRTQDDFTIRILVLGPFRTLAGAVQSGGGWRGFAQPAHSVLSLHGGNLHQGTAWFAGDGLHVLPQGGVMATANRGVRWSTRGAEWGNVVGAGVAIGEECDQAVLDAYRAARSARFEHGEHGGKP